VRTLALLGCESTAELNRSYVDVPSSLAFNGQLDRP